MESQQLSLFTEYEATRVEREALVRGALYNAVIKPRDVTKLAILCRAIWENGEETDFPPSIEDLVEVTGESKPTVVRRLKVLRELGLVQTKRDEGRSARDPVRRWIDWERTARLARREVCDIVSLAHGEPTGISLAHGEPTRGGFEPTKTADGSVCFGVLTPPPPKGSSPSSTEPTATVPVADAPGSQGVVVVSWSEAGRRLALAGVARWAAAVETAEARGVDPAEIVAIVEYAESRPGAWDGGAIYFRAINQVPGMAIEAGWQRPNEVYRRQASQASQERRARRQAAERSDDEVARRCEAEAFAAAWAEHGAAIEALGEAEQLELAGGGDPRRVAFWRDFCRRPEARSGVMFREALVEGWLRRMQPAGT